MGGHMPPVPLVPMPMAKTQESAAVYTRKQQLVFRRLLKTVFSKRIVFSEVELSGSLCGWGMRNMIFPCCGLMINIVHKLIAYVTAVNC